MSIVVAEERISPKLARQILDTNNSGNRPVSQARVAQYARDMLSDQWIATGDTLKFSIGGKLLDGQHRLKAVMESNKTISFMVARGVKSEAFTHIDIGKARNGTDVLAIEGLDPAIAKTVSTSARLAYSYQMGGVPRTRGLDSKMRLDNQATVEYVSKHPPLIEAAKFIHDNYKAGALLSRSVLTWALYEARRSGGQGVHDQADLFVLDVIQGTMLSREDPVFRLREVLVEERTSKRKSGEEMVLAAIVKAWNKRVRNEKISGPNRLLTRDWKQFPKFS